MIAHTARRLQVGLRRLGRGGVRRMMAPVRQRRRGALLTQMYDSVIESDTAFHKRLHADTRDYYDSMEVARFVEFVAQCGDDSHEYLDYHRFRLAELHSLVMNLVDELAGADGPFTLIEVSTAGDFFARHFTAAFGDRMTYVAFNYPDAEGGTGGDLTAYAALDIEADLNQLDASAIDPNLVALVADRPVIVLASEIVEHLLIDIENFVAFWARLCDQTTGRLIVTTPNYLSDLRLSAVLRGLSPQERYRKRDRVAAGFVHIREFAPKEMLDPVRSASLRNATCAMSFAMPGNDRPQRSLHEYLTLRDDVIGNGRDRSPVTLSQLLAFEGHVTVYELGR